jgi:hypothetical protein
MTGICLPTGNSYSINLVTKRCEFLNFFSVRRTKSKELFSNFIQQLFQTTLYKVVVMILISYFRWRSALRNYKNK